MNFDTYPAMGEKMSRVKFGMACILGAVGFLMPASATEQVYHPISPIFGGNPANGTFLLQTAQGQGEGVNSGNQGPNLSGLNLGNLGSGTGATTIIIPGSGTATTAGTSGVANPLSNAAKMP